MEKRRIGRAYSADMRAAECGPLEASWRAYPQSVDSVICRSWTTLVARSRHAVHDDGFFTRYNQSVQDNVVGSSGFRVESTPIGRGGKIDKALKEAIDDAWDDFSEKGVFEVTGGLSRSAFERLWVSTKAVTGEAMCLIIIDEELPWGFGLQMIDTMRLDPLYNEDLKNGGYIRHAIEFNRYGRPVAYHIGEDTGGVFSPLVRQGERRVRVPAEYVIHDFMPEFVGQKRGLPWARSILWRLRQFSRAEDSMIANLRASASKIGFFHNDGKDVELRQAGAEDDEEPEIAIDGSDAEMYDIGNKRFVSFDPRFPDAAVEPFMRTLARGISSGMNGNYYKIFNDLSSVSFSSIRQGELSERDYWRSHQVMTIDNLVRPVRLAWLKYSLLAGKIFSSKRKTVGLERWRDLKCADYKGRRWEWIDPQSEAAANALMMERNMKSLTEIISDQGGDFWSHLETIKNEREEMKAAGIDIYMTPGAGVLSSPGKADAGTEAQKKAP